MMVFSFDLRQQTNVPYLVVIIVGVYEYTMTYIASITTERLKILMIGAQWRCKIYSR